MRVGRWLLEGFEKCVCRAGMEALGGLDGHDSAAPQMWTQRQELSESRTCSTRIHASCLLLGSRVFLLVRVLIRAGLLKQAVIRVIAAGMRGGRIGSPPQAAPLRSARWHSSACAS